MTSKHYVLTLATATPLQLSSVLSGDPDDAKAAIWVSPRASNTGIIYIGTNGSISPDNYGIRLEIPVTSIPQAPFNFGEFAGTLEAFRSPLKLGQFWALGLTGDFLHILTINYGG